MRKRRRPELVQTRTIGGLVDAFKNSQRWRGWGPASRAKYGAFLVRLGDKNADTAVDAFTRGSIKRAMHEITTTRGPAAAANWLKVMKALYDYALDLEWVTSDPTHGVSPPPLDNPDGFQTWRDDQIEQFRAHHAVGSVPRLVMEVLFCTGASISDAVRLGWFSVRDGMIEYRRVKVKGGPLVSVPILPELAQVIEGLPADRPWLATQDGRTRSPKALTGDVARWCKAAGLPPGISAHGLRKARGRVLAEAGCAPHAIMAWLGHRTLKEAARYSAAYDRAAATRRAAEMLETAFPIKSQSKKIVPLKR